MSFRAPTRSRPDREAQVKTCQPCLSSLWRSIEWECWRGRLFSRVLEHTKKSVALRGSWPRRAPKQKADVLAKFLLWRRDGNFGLAKTTEKGEACETWCEIYSSAMCLYRSENPFFVHFTRVRDNHSPACHLENPRRTTTSVFDQTDCAAALMTFFSMWSDTF